MPISLRSLMRKTCLRRGTDLTSLGVYHGGQRPRGRRHHSRRAVRHPVRTDGRKHRPARGQTSSSWGRCHRRDPAAQVEVHGARENNLADISLGIPKRRLTVLTGVSEVSGSGKSSLVFGTIAAESQRLINETYTAFIKSFMPSLGRPDVDALRNLSAAIVDQERMGANSRSTVGTATDAQSGFVDPDLKLKDYPPAQWEDSLHKPVTKIKIAPRTSPTKGS